MSEQLDQATAVAEDLCPHCGHAVGEAWMTCASCGGPLAAAPELAPGTTVGGGRYQLLAVLGRGGFGITYDGFDARLQRPVAIKELFPESAVRHGSKVLTPPEARPGFRAARERFTREAQVLARFTHPGVVRVYEVFEEHGTAYLVMERLTGRTLVEVMRARRAPFDADEVLDVAGRVAAALRPIHAAGVLHRDVNPANVMLTEHGRIVLIDFGLARDFDLDQTIGMTRVVTPGYAPIEQYQGEARFGPATDVYGLAATLYRLATGQIPVAAVDRLGGQSLAAPHRLVPTLPKALSDGILDGLELDPAHRPQDMDAFLARIGVRRLPEGLRSVLLGSPGAEPEALAAHAPPAPVPPPPLPMPPPAEAVADPRPDELATVLVTRSAPEPTAPEATAPFADDDATVVPARVVVPAPGVGAPADGAAPAAAGVVAVALADRRRRLVVLPAALATIAVGTSLPALVVGLLVLVVLPLLATVGDHVVLDARSRVPTPVLVPARFVRNVGTSIVRTSPVVGIFALALALWFGLDATSLPQGAVEAYLRLTGAVAVAFLLRLASQGSPRWRTGAGIDAVSGRLAPDARVDQRVVVGWVLWLAVAAGGLWLVPSAWPIP